MAAVFFVIAAALFFSTLYWLLETWMNFENKKRQVEKGCPHVNTSQLSCWIDDNGKLQENDYCEDCGIVLRGGAKI